MRIAIHYSNADYNFSGRWIEYCKMIGVEFKIVNAYSTNIIKQIEDCDIFMWHHFQGSYKDCLFAKQLLYSLQVAGKRVFPDFNTGWYFDDKVGQKYLLESIGAPLVTSYVFYSKEDAFRWIDETTFPKVFKLRGGAGSANVKLAHTQKEARHLVRKAFGTGFSQYDKIGTFKERLYQWRQGKDSLQGVCISIIRFFVPPTFAIMHAPEKGYAYFQDFIPNNPFDIRIVVVGDKAFAIKRLCRDHDFRASGGGKLVYDKKQIDIRCVAIAFDVNEKIKAQSIAYDFIFDAKNTPKIVEISYGYSVAAYDKCEGYWTKDMQWHNGSHFDFCAWMVDNILKKDENPNCK